MRVFNLIWAGQATSLVGSAMTTFGIGVWIFTRTQSPTAFATLLLAGSLPGLLTLPFAGVLTDRWDRRRVMLLSDLGTVIGPLVLLFLNSAGLLQNWHLYVMVALASVFKAFQWPAFSSLVSQLVPKEQLSKANSRVGLAEAGGMVFGDLLGGALYGLLGLTGLLLVDLFSFAVALGTTLLSYRLRPKIPPVRTTDAAARAPMRTEMAEGWRFIRQRSGLLGLLLFFAGYNLMMGMALVLVSPLVLSSHPPSTLGVINAVGAVGMIGVSAVMSFTRQPRHLVRAIFVVAFLHSGLLLVMGSSHGTPWLLAVGMFGVLGGYAVINAVTATLWQRKTPANVQGRVFSVRRLLAWSADPVAFAVAGPLTEYVGRPLADAHGPLADSAVRLTGTGIGGGIGMVFLLSGLLLVGVVAVTAVPRAVRRMERDLPDADEAVPAGVVASS
ncbi:MFS transporter [Streptomyces sp. GD-15H]|uniref:MFS transporter n=1 Tax=Streptomyces sp. GD-15H TaxID=3129112 RepID=UPI00325522B1